jgi:hypothetical protein
MELKMKTNTRKNTFWVALAIAASANAPASFADGPFLSGLQAGNVNFSPTDVYTITCPVGTATVRASLSNQNGSNVDEITVQVTRPANNAANNFRTRSVIAHEGLATRTATLTVQPAQTSAERYLVTVTKDSTPVALALPYRLSTDCYNAAGAPLAGNQTVIVQNF